MGKITTFRPYLLAAAITVAGIAACQALPARAAGDGYSGLIAPSDDEDTPAPNNNTPSHTEDYKGPGYAGVVAPADDADESTAESIQTHDNFIKNAVMINNLRNEGEAAVASMRAPYSDYNAKLTHRVVDGGTDIEYSTKRTINAALSKVNDKSLSDTERSENARKAYQNLSSLADGFRIKQDIPDSVFKQMGLTDQFINEEKAGNATSLAELNDALNALKPYQ